MFIWEIQFLMSKVIGLNSFAHTIYLICTIRGNNLWYVSVSFYAVSILRAQCLLPTQALGHMMGLTHGGRVTHICISKLTIIGSDNSLPPNRRQAIIWTNARILLIGPLETNVSEILIVINTFSFRKMHLKMASAKWRPFCCYSWPEQTTASQSGTRPALHTVMWTVLWKFSSI